MITKTKRKNFRFTLEVIKAAAKAAKAQNRSLTGYIEMLIIRDTKTKENGQD